MPAREDLAHRAKRVVDNVMKEQNIANTDDALYAQAVDTTTKILGAHDGGHARAPGDSVLEIEGRSHFTTPAFDERPMGSITIAEMNGWLTSRAKKLGLG